MYSINNSNSRNNTNEKQSISTLTLSKETTKKHINVNIMCATSEPAMIFMWRLGTVCVPLCYSYTVITEVTVKHHQQSLGDTLIQLSTMI